MRLAFWSEKWLDMDFLDGFMRVKMILMTSHDDGWTGLGI